MSRPQMVRGLPLGWEEMTFIRSFVDEGSDGNLYRVEVREDPQSGMRVNARIPMPSQIKVHHATKGLDT